MILALLVPHPVKFLTCREILVHKELEAVLVKQVQQDTLVSRVSEVYMDLK